jgi:phosphatidylinositol glycan class O
MVYMQQLLRENSSQCSLFGFRADPPTVTSQRLKSITTGTLPTFIDIGANMNSSAVTDDNVIDQLLRVRRRKGQRQCCGECGGVAAPDSTCAGGGGEMVVLGDDTWGALFPTQFSTAHLYDSFNTRDLDKVDDGILSHLFEHVDGNKSAANDWDLMVAHFLGVDHIGHTHHAFHPLMAERLTLMDDTLRRVVAALPEDGILFLFGDHGMTDAGEHGGSSGNETDSGLFVYSKRPMFPVRCVPAQCHGVSGVGTDDLDAETSCGTAQALYWDDAAAALQFTPVDRIRAYPRTVSQLDLTPTLSLLLGLPVPASSLGMIIPELFGPSMDAIPGSREVRSDALADALFINAMQVRCSWFGCIR